MQRTFQNEKGRAAATDRAQQPSGASGHDNTLVTLHTNAVFFFCGGWGAPGHGKLAKPSYQKAPEKSLGIKDQSCPMLRSSHKGMWLQTCDLKVMQKKRRAQPTTRGYVALTPAFGLATLFWVIEEDGACQKFFSHTDKSNLFSVGACFSEPRACLPHILMPLFDRTRLRAVSVCAYLNAASARAPSSPR